MKTWIIVLVVGIMGSTAAFAEGYGVRYETTYDNWDHSFHGAYNYTETTTVTRTTNCFTCYDGFQSTSKVYVEERVVNSGPYNGHHVVHVYRDSGYTDRYATYYVSDTRLVYRRNFYYPPYGYPPVYYYPGYSIVYRDVDDATAAIVIGTEIALRGAILAAECAAMSRGGTDPGTLACYSIAGVVTLGGMITASVGTHEAMEQTELQRQIDAYEKSHSSAMDIQ